MKLMVGIAAAVAVGLGAAALLVALTKDGGSAFERQTLKLSAGDKKRVFFEAPVTVKGHPVRVKGWELNYVIEGDRSGELSGTCVPVLVNEVDCAGAFLLEDGDIQWVNTENQEKPTSSADASIVGGSGAYENAIGTLRVNWESDTYTLEILTPA